MKATTLGFKSAIKKLVIFSCGFERADTLETQPEVLNFTKDNTTKTYKNMDLISMFNQQGEEN